MVRKVYNLFNLAKKARKKWCAKKDKEKDDLVLKILVGDVIPLTLEETIQISPHEEIMNEMHITEGCKLYIKFWKICDGEIFGRLRSMTPVRTGRIVSGLHHDLKPGDTVESESGVFYELEGRGA